MKLRGKSSQQEQQRNAAAESDHRANLGAPAERDVNPDYVDQMLDSQLDRGTVDMLENLLSSDWVLSKMSDAEVHEMRWLARTMSDEVDSMHPPEDSIWSGKIRAYAAGDAAQGLTPLNNAERLTIFEFIQGFIARVARSKDGFQQENFKKQIRKSEREDKTEQDQEGWIKR